MNWPTAPRARQPGEEQPTSEGSFSVRVDLADDVSTASINRIAPSLPAKTGHAPQRFVLSLRVSSAPGESPLASLPLRTFAVSRSILAEL